MAEAQEQHADIVPLSGGAVYRPDNGKFYTARDGEYYAMPATPEMQAEVQSMSAPPQAEQPMSPAAPQDAQFQKLWQQTAGAQDPRLTEPGPIDYKAGAMAALSGGSAGLAGSAAMKALPFMAARTAPAAAARALHAGVGSAVPYFVKDVATGQFDPLNTAFNVAAGTLGGLGGSVGERTWSSAKEAGKGGGQGLMTRVANKVMDIVGLPSIEKSQLEKTFTAAKPVGI